MFKSRSCALSGTYAGAASEWRMTGSVGSHQACCDQSGMQLCQRLHMHQSQGMHLYCIIFCPYLTCRDVSFSAYIDPVHAPDAGCPVVRCCLLTDCCACKVLCCSPVLDPCECSPSDEAAFACPKHYQLVQAGVADITAALRSYRPSQTVLEAEVAAPRRGMGAGANIGPLSGADDARSNVMRLKRKRHDSAILVRPPSSYLCRYSMGSLVIAWNLFPASVYNTGPESACDFNQF